MMTYSAPFEEDPDWWPDFFDYHHEPRLQRSSMILVNEAKEVRQDECETINEQDSEDYLTTRGLGPCIFLTAHRPGRLGAIHFDTGSNIALLIEELKSRLHTSDLQGYDLRLYGGIKGMEGSDLLRENLSRYLSAQKIPLAEDHSMQAEQENLEDIDQMGQFLFSYQCLIVCKKSGLALSFDPFTCERA